MIIHFREPRIWVGISVLRIHQVLVTVQKVHLSPYVLETHEISRLGRDWVASENGSQVSSSDELVEEQRELVVAHSWRAV